MSINGGGIINSAVVIVIVIAIVVVNINALQLQAHPDTQYFRGTPEKGVCCMAAIDGATILEPSHPCPITVTHSNIYRWLSARLQ